MNYQDQDYKLSKREQFLREQMVCVPEVCIERAVLMTSAYMDSEGEPYVIKRANALKKILSEKSIRIEPGELIVGWQTSKYRGAPVLPEISVAWLDDEMDDLENRAWDPYQPMSEEDKKIIREYVIPYWRGKSLNDQIYKLVPKELQKYNHLAWSSMGFSENNQHFAHCTGDFGKILRVGVKGMMEEIREEMKKIDYSKSEDLHKYHELRGMLISYEGVLIFAERYSKLAEETAQTESNPTRKKELENIAAICRKVPYEPAESFYEALQFIWFIFVALMDELWGVGLTFGRIDQFLYPYYEKDIKEGKITQEQATELLALLLIKMNGESVLQDKTVAMFLGGYPIMPGLTIGGVDKDGNDVVNALSYLFLDAEKAVGLTSDDFVIRVNSKNPKSFLIKAVQTSKALKGKMKFVSDKTTISSLKWTGIPEKMANDYISTGCHNPTIPAETHDMGGGSFNYPLILDLVLHRGVSSVTGEILGIDTGDPVKIETFEQLCDAFEKQFEYVANKVFCFKNADLKLFEQLPWPLMTSMYHGTIQKGLDINENGVYYRTHTTSITGAPNVGDSLAALKKTVFDDKTLSMERVLSLLDNNLEGDDEALYLLRKVPKFGNNDPYVDGILRDVLEKSCDFLHTHEAHNRVHTTAACLAMTINIPFGTCVGALPDGRKAGEPLSEGGISPYQGRNVSGLSASMASVAALNQMKLSHGSILNLRVSPGALKTPDKIEKFADLIMTFAETGGNLVQFNFVDQETLIDAQKHPERYKDLLVRVATYSAYFVNLSKPLQDDIINRTIAEEI